MIHRPMLLPCTAVLSLALVLAACSQPATPASAAEPAPQTGGAPGAATPGPSAEPSTEARPGVPGVAPGAGTPAASPAPSAPGVSGGAPVTNAAFSLRPLTEGGLVRGVLSPGPEAVPAADVAVKNVVFKVLDAGGKVVLEKAEGAAPYCLNNDPGPGNPCNAWDTTTLPDGRYSLNATLTRTDGSTAQASVNFVIANARSVSLEDARWVHSYNIWGPIERHMSNGEQAAGDGHPFSVGGVAYPNARGYGVHSGSQMTFAPGGACQTLTAQVGVDDETPGGSVEFQVIADGQTVYQSGVLRRGQAAKALSVSVAGKQRVQLKVTDGGDGPEYDHADWIEPALGNCSAAYDPAAVVYDPPVKITQGGFYSGNWESQAAATSAVDVSTGDPVTLYGANVRSRGNLITSAFVGAHLTVRDTRGVGLNPNVNGRTPGRFVAAEEFKSLTIEHNAFEGTSGMYFRAWTGTAGTGETIKIRYNSAKNIDGRKSNGSGGWQDINARYLVVPDPTPENPNNTKHINVTEGFDRVQFTMFNNVHDIPNAEIAWNNVLNEPGNSRTEDNINMYDSRGLDGSHIVIHDNLIYGSYTSKPAQATYIGNDGYTYDWVHSGSGIVTDGCDKSLTNPTAYVDILNNTVLETTNAGIGSTDGHHITVQGNRVFATGRLNDTTPIASQNLGTMIWNICNLSSFDRTTQLSENNVVGWGVPRWGDTTVNNIWVHCQQYVNKQCVPGTEDGIVNNNEYVEKGPIPASRIQDEIKLWQQKLSAAGLTVGPR